MAQKKLISKVNPFSGVRAVITGTQSGASQTWYSEGRGDRFYVNEITATASPVLESATFVSYLSFTMSGLTTTKFDLIPMSTGESAFIETIIYGQNSGATAGYCERFFSAWRHSGSALTLVGGTVSSTKLSDFTTVGTNWSTTGTQSINFTITGQTGQVIDFDVHIRYTKGTHKILTGGSSGGSISPIYPTS